uniref:Uncharacterized protein n=1 Tax=Arundo donax TaxID=35708 RepID=A0A0A8ZMR3_ARUDO
MASGIGYVTEVVVVLNRRARLRSSLPWSCGGRSGQHER